MRVVSQLRFGSRAWLTSNAHGAEYVISMPNMYARGILWGKMFLELGDSCTAKNEQTGHYAEIQFKTKVRPPFPARALTLSLPLARLLTVPVRVRACCA